MEKNETEQINGAEVQVGRLELETHPQNMEQVTKVRFKTDKGDITWKPKLEKEEYRDGLVIKKAVPMEFDFLPEKIKEIGKRLQSGQLIKMKVNYTKMCVDNDGTKNEYRFIRSAKTLEKWEFIDVTEKVE